MNKTTKPRYAKPIPFKPVKLSELHPSLRKIDLKLYNAAMKAIADEPSQFDMMWWYDNLIIDPRTKKESAPPNCGTAACFGGWVFALKKRKNPRKAWALLQRLSWDVSGTISKLLKLPLEMGDGVGDRLFSHSYWPKGWDVEYQRHQQNGSHRKAAQVALKRFKHFLLTAE